MTVHIGIVGHIARSQQARNLMHETRAGYLSLDNGHYGCFGNHKRVWEWLTTTNKPSIDDWLVVIEDDAIPCLDFRNQLEQALAVAPAHIVSLYLGRQRPPQYQYAIEPAVERANTEDASWIVGRTNFHGVGLAIRSDLAHNMITELNPELPIDEAINDWATGHHYRIAYTYPSLLEHQDGETLLKHRDGDTRPPGRKAWKHGQRNTWTHNIVEMNT